MKTRFVLIITHDTWMSAQKVIPFQQVAKANGYSTILVAASKRYSMNEDILILDPLSHPIVLSNKLKKYKNQIDFVFSGYDMGSVLIAAAAEEVGATYMSKSLAQHLQSKYSLSLFLAQHKLNTPRTWLIHDRNNFSEIPDKINLMIKSNVSSGANPRHSWDYRSYQNKNDLIAYLEAEKLMDAFVKTAETQALNQSIVQEMMPSDKCLDVHIVFREKGEYKIFLIGEFFSRDSDFLIVESKSAENISEAILVQIKMFADFFSALGLQNIVTNFQFVEKSNLLYLFDLNLRVAGIWSYLYPLMLPDFYEKLFLYFQEKSINFDLKYSTYLKTPYWLEEGKIIQSIQFPTYDKMTIRLAYLDHLIPGYKVPQNQNSIQPSPQIFAVGNSAQECRDKIVDVLNRTRVEYKI